MTFEIGFWKRVPLALPVLLVLNRVALALPVSLILVLAISVSQCSLQAQESLSSLRQQAIQQATASAADSIVRIETVGGADVVGEELTATGPTSGVVVRADGLIITSRFNFISKPASILVTLPDGRKLAARVLSEDLSRMLTLLKVDADNLRPLTAVPKSSIRVGQTVIALGRTFDLTFPNVSTGIISALDRVWGRAVQTDAKVSPVNYGGALIDLTGRCVGVLVPLDPSKEEETAGVEWYDSGIGFAIPYEEILRVLDRMVAGETLKRGLMGVNFEDKGALSGEAKIQHVRPGSPAALAGIRKEDVIVEIADRPVLKVNDLKHAIGPSYAGDTVSVRLRRGDQEQQLQVKLTDVLKPYQFPYAGILPAREVDSPAKIHAVIPGSPAEQAGLQPGDIVEQLDAVPISGSPELSQQILRRSPNDVIALQLKRGESQLKKELKLVPFPDAASEVAPATRLANPPAQGMPPTGRLNETLPGTEHSYWVHIPETYQPKTNWGLLICLHPVGNVMEAEILRAWEQTCRERGIILLGPRAVEGEPWSDNDAAAIVDMVESLSKRYSIDPRRVSVLGIETSSSFATKLAFRERELVRGLVLVRGAFRSPPPDNDPESPLLLALVPADDVQRKVLQEITNAMQKECFPTQLLPNSSKDGPKFPPDLIKALANWLDALDRI